MSAVIRRDNCGVLLRYPDPGVLRRHHVERRVQVSDAQRNELIAAERAVRSLTVIFEHLGVSEIGMTRVRDELCTIRHALSSRRPDLGLKPQLLARRVDP